MVLNASNSERDHYGRACWLALGKIRPEGYWAPSSTDARSLSFLRDSHYVAGQMSVQHSRGFQWLESTGFRGVCLSFIHPLFHQTINFHYSRFPLLSEKSNPPFSSCLTHENGKTTVFSVYVCFCFVQVWLNRAVCGQTDTPSLCPVVWQVSSSHLYNISRGIFFRELLHLPAPAPVSAGTPQPPARLARGAEEQRGWSSSRYCAVNRHDRKG